ncbi:RYamide receptor [Folsomia candida]|uniref:Neuropeptide Y receptor n=1 Tax=Folsomia candida TaxID=158441 RepID=A0A226EHB4_FOLCA|nr:RYamide receptor [Folsomia candida]OXA56972.1 Neuropeptide Y receptor [Folsomia candida]
MSTIDPSYYYLPGEDGYLLENFSNVTAMYPTDLISSPSDMPPPPSSEPVLTFPPHFQLLIYLVYNFIFISAVIGNILVIYVVASSPRMRTVTNYLIASLALGDLLMALLCVPFSYISVLLQYWPFGLILCHLVSPAQATCVFVSAYTLVALAVDRYIAILYPLRPRLRRSQALAVILGVWIVALITAAPIAVFTRLEVDEQRAGGLPLCEESAWSDDTLRLAYSLTLMILQYFLPISVLAFTYSRIVIAVWGKKPPGEAEDNRDQRLARAKRKTIKTTLLVISTYTLAWLPLNLFQLYMETFTNAAQLPNIEYIFIVCHLLAMGHSAMNPIIYGAFNDRFRESFTSVLSGCSRYSRKNGGSSSNNKTSSRGSTSVLVYSNKNWVRSTRTAVRV